MDIFGTVITSGTVILQFLGACADYSDDAKSLKARFDWDLRVLEAIRSYFQQRLSQSPNHQLAPDDAALLERTAGYLDYLVGKVHRNLGKIERKGLLGGMVNRALWIARQADLKEMEHEVYEWTRRFDIRVLGLPPELRAVLPAALDIEPPAVVKANDELRKFVKVASSVKETRAKEMWLQDSDELASEVESWDAISFLPLSYEGRELIFASRMVPPDVMPGTQLFENLKSEMGFLAAALNCLDPAAHIHLLKVESYFYHASRRQFLFVHIPPQQTMSMMTLEETIEGDRFPKATNTLDKRLKIALQLAEAVLFLHSAGFVHKNITSSSVAIFQRSESLSDDGSDNICLDDAYLMGYDLIRDIEAKTYQEGTVRGVHEDPGWVWYFGIYQHPDRLAGQSSPRYTKTYDIYSLGVLMLEIGLWEPLSDVLRGLDIASSTSWGKELSKRLSALGSRAGERYKNIVAWCLALTGDIIVKEDDFVNCVLNPLEDMVNSLS